MQKPYTGIVLVGPPAVGKGTQAELLANYTNLFHHASTGQMLRDEEYMTERFAPLLNLSGVAHKGEFSPDQAIVDYFYHVLEHRQSDGKFDPTRQIILMDGIPRTVPQIGLLKDGVDVMGVMRYDARKRVLRERFIERGRSKNRTDNLPELFDKRMGMYVQLTKPVAKSYWLLENKIVRSIRAEGSIENVFELSKAAIGQIIDQHQ